MEVEISQTPWKQGTIRTLSYCFRFCGLFGGVQDMFCRHNILPHDGSPHDWCQKLKGPEGGHTKRVRSPFLSTNFCASQGCLPKVPT